MENTKKKGMPSAVNAPKTPGVTCDCHPVIHDKLVVVSNKVEKVYKVRVRFVKLTDEEARKKRATIEDIMKNGYKGKGR